MRPGIARRRTRPRAPACSGRARPGRRRLASQALDLALLLLALVVRRDREDLGRACRTGPRPASGPGGCSTISGISQCELAGAMAQQQVVEAVVVLRDEDRHALRDARRRRAARSSGSARPPRRSRASSAVRSVWICETSKRMRWKNVAGDRGRCADRRRGCWRRGRRAAARAPRRCRAGRGTRRAASRSRRRGLRGRARRGSLDRIGRKIRNLQLARARADLIICATRGSHSSPSSAGADKGSVAGGATRGGGIGDHQSIGTRCGTWAPLGQSHAETGGDSVSKRNATASEVAAS